MKIAFDHREFARLQAADKELQEVTVIAGQRKQDLELLAGAIVKTQAFTEWLLMQDNSSTMTDLRPGMGYGKSGTVEGKSDLELALEWAGRP